jgi:hypothetical protein
LRGEFGLVLADVGRFENRLAVEVGDIDNVIINDGDVTDAAPAR